MYNYYLNLIWNNINEIWSLISIFSLLGGLLYFDRRGKSNSPIQPNLSDPSRKEPILGKQTSKASGFESNAPKKTDFENKILLLGKVEELQKQLNTFENVLRNTPTSVIRAEPPPEQDNS